MEQMHRWEMNALGLDKLTLNEVARPVAKPGEILVEVEAVSLNFRDSEVIEHGMGIDLTFPLTPTSDMAGRVVAIGEGVTRFGVGERVMSMCIVNWIDGASLPWSVAPTQGGPLPGMLASYVALPEQWLVRAPDSLDAIQACTLPTAALTAWMALIELGHLKAGQTVVVQGTGGVSLFAIQIAAAHGARVIVTSSSGDKLTRARALGAAHGIDRSEEPDWQRAVLSITNGRGADHILEMAGGENVVRSLEAISNGGRISVIGLLESDACTLPILPLLGSRASVVGISVGPRRALEDLVRMIDQSALKPVIDRVYSFTEAVEAFNHIRRGPFGKVVITVN